MRQLKDTLSHTPLSDMRKPVPLHNLIQTAPNAYGLDVLLVEYFHELLDSGQGRAKAVCTLFGIVMYIPRFRHQLPTARLALRGWGKLRPSEPYPPLTLTGHRLPDASATFLPRASVLSLLSPRFLLLTAISGSMSC